MMNFTNFRIWWFERLSVEASLDLRSYFTMNLEVSLEALCKEDYNVYQEELLKVAAAEAAAATRTGSLGIRSVEQIEQNLKPIAQNSVLLRRL